MDTLLTIKEIVPILRISASTVYDMVQKKEIASIKIRNKIFVKREVVDRILNEGTQKVS